MKVLKVVDQDNKPIVSIIFKSMCMVKLALQDTLYSPTQYLKIVDSSWNKTFHNDLHATGKISKIVFYMYYLLNNLIFIIIFMF